MEYYWSSKYDCVEVNGQEYITFKKKNPDDPTVLIIPSEEFFDVLMPIHVSCGHVGRDKILKNIKNKFYVPKKAIEILTALCPVCGHKKNNSSDVNKSNTVQITDCFNVRGVLDIIDFQSFPDGDYKWLLKYQDHTTKFFNFRPLKTNEHKEIAMELVKIFLTFGPPSILQSLTGNESIDDILKEIRNIWPSCKTINATNQGGSHQLNESQSKRNTAIATMLLSWMNENNLTNWSVGCYFYQNHINTSTFAYKALFCRDYKYSPNSTTVLSTMLLPTEDVVTENANVHSKLSLIPKTSTTVLNAGHSSILESHNKIVPVPNKSTMLSDENSTFLNTQMEQYDYEKEIKIEFDDPEIPLEEDNYDTEGDLTNPHKNIEGRSADQNTGCDDTTEYFYSKSGIKLFKTEAIEEAHHLQITCRVCQGAALIENTIVCFNCNSNIHKRCATYVTGEEIDSNVLCNKCPSKAVTKLHQKSEHIGMKRASEDTVGNTLKRILPSASDSNKPGPSSD